MYLYRFLLHLELYEKGPQLALFYTNKISFKTDIYSQI
jgi:hypothetical protein